MFIEYISLFYRTLIPTPLWFGYFSNYYDTGAVFAIMVTTVYLMIKGAVIISKGKELIRATLNFIRDKVIIVTNTNIRTYATAIYSLSTSDTGPSNHCY